MILCPTCGNKVDPGLSQCAFCDTALKSSTNTIVKPGILHRIVNLEYGRPVVESALKRMHNELEQAKLDGVKVVTLIHGYGSSGKGGRIRVECRKSLHYLRQKNILKEVVHGEIFHRRSGFGKALVRQYPHLEQLCKSDFSNPGITVVVF